MYWYLRRFCASCKLGCRMVDTLFSLTLYALLWLQSVGLPATGVSAARLLQHPDAWRRVELVRTRPLAMKALLDKCKRGANAMEALGHVVYAWLLPELLLRGVKGAGAWMESWQDVSATPRQHGEQADQCVDAAVCEGLGRLNEHQRCPTRRPEVGDGFTVEA